jgi:SAM-dependent methyltransferase
LALKREGLHKRPVSQVNILGFNFELLDPYASILPDELPVWEKNYLPVSVKGKIVLDVGAGCGETSAFYIAHGASKVVAIEPDKRAYSLLLKNAKANSLNVLPIRKPFELSDLLIPHDLLKINAEGAEVTLLDYQGSLGPCVVEAPFNGNQSRAPRSHNR